MLHTSRELAEKTGIVLDTFKRWSRAFLPSDPEAGRQSGRVRRFSLNEGFLIFLGGHLVGQLKFSVDEAQMILRDLDDWLIKENLHPEATKIQKTTYKINIMECLDPKGSFSYEAKGTIEKKELLNKGTLKIFEEKYIWELIKPKGRGDFQVVRSDRLAVLEISRLLNEFKHKMINK